MRSRLLPTCFALPLLAGCGSSTEPLLDELPRALSPAEGRVIDSGNEFSFALFREAARSLPADSNAFLSPLSASFSLGMVLNGARGETFEAMRGALRFGGASQTEINEGYRDLIRLLVGLDRRTDIQVANSMWIRTGFEPLLAFVDAARTYFDAEVRSLDFASSGSVGTINGWVSEKTRGRITRLLESIAADEVLFLINAIYFKGAWRLRFDKAQTRPEGFQGADGVTRQVPMMRLGGEDIRFASAADLDAVDLLYGNGAFAMTVLLPRPPQTPAGLLQRLDPSAWAALTEQFAEQEVALGLPRFRLEYSRSLRDDLSALGMGIAFDDQRADLGGIANPSFGRLFLTRVVQKTFVEVNEEGTEAAAATATGVGVTSAPRSFVVNRPFLFAIRERFSGTILFLGLVNVLGQ